MQLNKANKKWYCSVCIKPEIINTPYILTEDEIASISLKCDSCGEIYLISEYDEKLFHIITSIFGSGPAWYLELSSKIVEAAEQSGLEKSEANKIIRELVRSLPSFLSDDEFSSTVDKIKSPNGTTEAGLNSLVNDSFDKIIYNAINSATNKSHEISQEINND